MAKRINKAALKWARSQLSSLQKDRSREEIGQLLTAAGLIGASRHRRDLEWLQPPPPRTVLDWADEGVMLTFASGSELLLAEAADDKTLKQARTLLETQSLEVQKALECLALKALEGNLRWIAAPPFESPESPSHKT